MRTNFICKKGLACLILALVAATACAQELYVQTFGDSKNAPLIFLHGGPGYNAAGFEVTTAPKLAEKGFFVVVYDRRGEGRSKQTKAQFNFNETFADLHKLYQQYGFAKATLVGHSFGGAVATLFAAQYPEKIQALVLVAAPVSMQATLGNILAKSKQIYQAKNDQTNLNYLSLIEKMDTASIQYSSYCFAHAMQNGFYATPNPSAEALRLYATFQTDSTLVKYAAQMSYEAPMGFWKNEQYTTLNLTPTLYALQARQVKIYGLYGKDDGLYAPQQIAELQQIVGKQNVQYLADCSHNVFIDQQTQFINALSTWVR